jgi:hypothetical protein
LVGWCWQWCQVLLSCRFGWALVVVDVPFPLADDGVG